MIPAVWVIDDFLKNAEEVRAQALQLRYERTGHYPGRGSVEKLNIGGLNEVVSALSGQRLDSDWPPEVAHATCRLTLAADVQEALIHVDVSHLSGILYLSRDEDCRGGTEFFRHKRTGTDRMPVTAAELEALGYASYEELEQDLLKADGADRSKWEPAMTVPMRFNRLILLHPHYWHTAGPGFGDTVDNGRLVYLMFFKRAAAP